MGEQHPAEKKVVLEFCPSDFRDLTDIQVAKLKKLVGPRYSPKNDIVKMSCEMFETQAQNKRYLGDTVEALLKEAKVSSLEQKYWSRLISTRILQTHSRTFPCPDGTTRGPPPISQGIG